MSVCVHSNMQKLSFAFRGFLKNLTSIGADTAANGFAAIIIILVSFFSGLPDVNKMSLSGTPQTHMETVIFSKTGKHHLIIKEIPSGSQDAKEVAYTVTDLPSDFNPSKNVFESIMVAAEKADVDPGILIAIAYTESRFDPKAGSKTSSAQGLFQFIRSTWLHAIKEYGYKHGLGAEAQKITLTYEGSRPVYKISDPKTEKRILGLRDNPKINAIMAAEMFAHYLEKTKELENTVSESLRIRLSHFLGINKSIQLMTTTGATPVVQVVGAKVADRNTGVLGGRNVTVRQALSTISEHMDVNTRYAQALIAHRR